MRSLGSLIAAAGLVIIGTLFHLIRFRPRLRLSRGTAAAAASSPREQLQNRPASTFVRNMLAGTPKPAGVSFKQYLYQCFEQDVALGLAENSAIPPHGPPRLRVVSFNVHFYRAGFSDVELADSTADVLGIVETLRADVVCLQEVPASAVASTQQRLAALGLTHSVAAGSPDVHVLPAKQASFAGERLHVLVASRLPFVDQAAVPMLDGHAAFAEVSLPGGGTALVYSLHLSVRCEAEKRQREAAAVLAHLRERGARRPEQLVLLAGDLNQPNEADYPAREWQAISADLSRANLPLNDGVMDTFRAAGLVPSFEAAAQPRPLPPSTAWNAALVDYIYTSGKSQGYEPGPSYAYYTLASDHLPLVHDLLPLPRA